MKLGLYTLIIENHMNKFPGFYGPAGGIFVPFSNFEWGWGMGYVLLPSSHPFYGKYYDNINVNVHGGLTFSESFSNLKFLEWIEGREIIGDVTRDNFEKFNNYWIIGFDTNHSGDNLVSCSKKYVINETNYLLKQCLDDKIEGIKNYKDILRKDKLKAINSRPGIGSDFDSGGA